MRDRDTLLHEALLLSPKERASLADALEESLDFEEVLPADAVSEWTVEIDRRLQAYAASGKSIDADESLDRVQQALISHRISRETK